MKASPTVGNRIVYCISLLYVFLFVYAATGKLSDFQNFQVQIGQSPLLSAFAGWVAWLVPLIEILISILLVFAAYRRIALYLAFSLMAMFTTYIFIILNYASFVPCSCGGILEKLGWAEHLVFNLVFIALATVAIFLSEPLQLPITLRRLLVCCAASIAIITVLFIFSEDTMRYRNNFVRRFMRHPAVKTNEIDLRLNGYYIAGSGNGKIYLGHPSAPLHLLETDTSLGYQKKVTLTLSRKDFPFRSMRTQVLPPYFYFIDGTVPVVFRGFIGKWHGQPWILRKDKFLKAEALPDGKLALRLLSKRYRKNVLGVADSLTRPTLFPGLLEAQQNGMFDTDGSMIYNAQHRKLIYTYFYRNQYVVADETLQLAHRGHTIDTFSQAQVKAVHLESDNSNKLSIPPLVVNKTTATYGKYLFVHSAIPGKYEREWIWKRASVIDVYDFTLKTYVFSFYIQNEMEEQLSEFIVSGHTVIAIVGHKLVVYRLQTNAYQPKTP